MSMFSAMAEIVAVIRVVDNATSPLSRVGNAAKATASVVRALGDAAIGMAGAKGLYDWTIGAAQHYQMMQLGLGAIIQMHSKLSTSAAAGMSVAEQAQEKYNIGLQISQEMLDKLQVKALSGVGTFQEYASMYQTLAPTLIGALGKNAFTTGGEEKMANFINMAEHFKAIMMSAYGNGQKANDLTARELSMILNKGARSNEPVMRSLFPEYLGKIKEFNEMSLDKKFKLMTERLNEFAIVSGDISKTWSAISTSIIDVFQMLGRNIGMPIMRALSDLALHIPGMKDLLGIRTDAEKKSGAKGNDAAMGRQEGMADRIRDFGKNIAFNVIAPFIILQNTIIPAIQAHWVQIKTITIDIVKGFIAMKAAAMAMNTGRALGGIANALAGSRVGAALLGPLIGALTGAGGRFMAALAAPMARLGLSASAAAPALTAVGNILMRIVGIGVGFAVVVVAISAVITIIAVLASNFQNIRNIIVTALIMTFEQLKATMLALWPIIKVLIGILIVVGVIIGAVVIAAFILLMGVFRLVAQVIERLVKSFYDMCKDLMNIFQAIINGFYGIVNGIAQGLNWLAGKVAEWSHGLVKPGLIDGIGSPPQISKVLGDISKAGSAAIDGIINQAKGMAMGAAKAWQDGVAEARRRYDDPKHKNGLGGALQGVPTEGHDKEGKPHKPKKGPKPHHPKTTNVFQRGAINIEIKNMNNYPPDRIAYDMKKALLDKVQYKTTNTNGGIGSYSATFGGY